ncbi:hypothetical protein DUNSADRAFT_14487 [Dunaliella salina]|uniref:Chromo domain-containing protein n=1 Tax=Dunaliella salina TaxID=3046 RepID=A0ABQ7H2J9_DUNSA|nr:hypothetical protein DUNSADRAFT_14487 [Dunaliella salina]|eukprot:KAF5841088.1 hypothetical protein DUNSADRAFT_14487 [Dunaliella salina]
MAPPPPRVIEEVTEADGGVIKIKISIMKNKQLKCWWSDTDRVNPLGMAEPGGNKPFVWRGAGVWARFWEACSKSTRPFTRTPEQVADAEKKSKQPRKGETYEVEKVLAFDPEASDDAYFLVKWFGYDSPSDNTQEPATSFGAGLDTYTWSSQEAWQHFCREGPSTFNPTYAPGPVPVSKNKKAAEAKEPRAGQAEKRDPPPAAAAAAAPAPAPAAAPPTKRPCRHSLLSKATPQLPREIRAEQSQEWQRCC